MVQRRVAKSYKKISTTSMSKDCEKKVKRRKPDE